MIRQLSSNDIRRLNERGAAFMEFVQLVLAVFAVAAWMLLLWVLIAN